ncbi:hypothetical protein CBR_g49200 [Chara braunii]|uniref:Aspartic peptidase DDI1-type domain-containing protein n=1 Tax=Chara braunii TaxID=69332 RepID=A0A388M494_CHABU|nr:hypothetical protein CBR_g49200 [Chara braunii]|eukprot:GBG89410.1 hypothetical protein CBR_g49200 [Chara braunii]
MGEHGDGMITRAALDMRLMGVGATHEVDGSRTRTDKTDTGTTDMRGRTEMDTGVAGMREEIETETDEMTRADDMTAGDTRGHNATIRRGGTTEEIGAMSHAGDTTMKTAGMTQGDDMSKEDLEETAAMIGAGGMREGDMARRLIRIQSPLIPEQPGVRSLGAQTTGRPLPGTLASTCSILEYLAASKPARDELQMITRKTRIPLSEEVQVTPKAEAPTVAVSEVTARADRMAAVLLDGMEGVPPDKFYILGIGVVEAILNDGAVLDVVIDNGSEAVIIDEDLAEQVGLGLDRSYLFEIETADGRKHQITGVCHKAAIEVQGVRVTVPVFAVKNCSSDLLLGRTWLSHVHVVTIERPDRNQTLSIKKLDGTRDMIETVGPRDPRNRAALVVGAGPSDRIKSLPISGRAVRFREKKYGPLLTEEEGRIVEVEDLGNRLIMDENSYPKERNEEFGGVITVSFLRAQPPYAEQPKHHKRVAQKVKPVAVRRERSALGGISEEEISKEIKERKKKNPLRRIAEMDIERNTAGKRTSTKGIQDLR